MDLVTPKAFGHTIQTRTLEEAGAPEPFEGAECIKTLGIRPNEPTDRTFFLSVLSPRRSNDPRKLKTEQLAGENVSSVRILQGQVEDVVAFALQEPEGKAGGIEFVGRTAFVRRQDGQITCAALHNGQRLSLDGQCLFETDGCGHAVLRYHEDAVDVTLDLYGCSRVRLLTSGPPTTVRVDGNKREFEFDVDTQTVRVDLHGGREVRIIA